MRVLVLGCAAAIPVFGHMVSMSTGDLRVDGARAHYELRIPMYEVAHVRDPQHAFFEHINFKGRGGPARALQRACSNQQDTYVCTADYQFPSQPDAIAVDCTFASITVPNHVHLLRAYRGPKTDQAVFDFSFTSAELRFRPPSAFETGIRGASAGLMRAIEGAAPLLFLAALVLAARDRRELLKLYAALIGGELAAIVAVPALRLNLPPRFIEAAAALTIAYLAVEIALLPQSRARWLIVGVLGLFHGLYFASFLTDAGYGAGPFFMGVVLAQGLVIFLLGLATRRVLSIARVVPVAASVLLCAGLAWFFMRLWA